jgi:hypothetical protein
MYQGCPKTSSFWNNLMYNRAHFWRFFEKSAKNRAIRSNLVCPSRAGQTSISASIPCAAPAVSFFFSILWLPKQVKM